jgi:hypothetical protein
VKLLLKSELLRQLWRLKNLKTPIKTSPAARLKPHCFIGGTMGEFFVEIGALFHF